eukprot:TRINITY_DN8372_c0_g1_i2.p1 TRINITY_DN8372_c0_g1~~TRINITY_DN8372_c0_g1_i2.p1  ORF type:complete len:297 (+),score=87.81 TRINITY_DN8372_c0_g1_i2:151-1041(+)
MALPAVAQRRLTNLMTEKMDVDNTTDNVAQERLQALLALQGPALSYMTSTQKGSLLPTMRDSTIGFVRQIAQRKGVPEECVIEAVHKLDTFLSFIKIQPKHLRIVAICCLHVAMEANPRCRKYSGTAWSRMTNKIFSANDFDRMLKIVRQKLAKHPAKASPATILHAVLPCLDLMTLPEPQSQRKLDAIPEDAEMGFERQQVEACYELAREHLGDLVKRYSILASMNYATLVVTAITFSLEELFAEKGYQPLQALCKLLQVDSSQLKQSLWLAAAETAKAFPISIATSIPSKGRSA